MYEDERFEYFKDVFTYFKKLEEENKELKEILHNNGMDKPIFGK